MGPLDPQPQHLCVPVGLPPPSLPSPRGVATVGGSSLAAPVAPGPAGTGPWGTSTLAVCCVPLHRRSAPTDAFTPCDPTAAFWPGVTTTPFFATDDMAFSHFSASSPPPNTLLCVPFPAFCFYGFYTRRLCAPSLLSYPGGWNTGSQGAVCVLPYPPSETYTIFGSLGLLLCSPMPSGFAGSASGAASAPLRTLPPPTLCRSLFCCRVFWLCVSCYFFVG